MLWHPRLHILELQSQVHKIYTYFVRFVMLVDERERLSRRFSINALEDLIDVVEWETLIK